MNHTQQSAALDAAPSPAALRVIQCGTGDGERWDRFVGKNAGGSFYHLFAWKALNETLFGHETFYLAAIDTDDVICGVFPLVFVRSRLFGRILCSMPFLNYGGPCAIDTETTQALLAEAKSIAQECDADYLEIRALEPVDSSLPTSLRKISLTLSLPADANVLWDAFGSKHRKNINRAYKNDFRTEHGGLELLDPFYTVLADSWRELGTPIYRKDAFAKILAAFPEQTRVFIVYCGDEPAAAAFTGYYRGTVEGMWLGIRPKYRALSANYVLYWEMMKDACAQGCTTFHLGRSTADSSAETFKKKWCAEAKQLYWHYHLCRRETIPDLNPDNPKYRLAIQIWRKLPIGLTTAIGPWLANNIP